MNGGELMAWVHFTEVFNYDRRPKQAVAFVMQPGVRSVPRDVADAAIAAGKATEVRPPPRRQSKSTKTPAA
ncbi:hypothetical protein KGO5_04247 [Sinorhizobium sp. KGO-5]|uniref:hypothetical protein n=1 Tax=Sinorhizobium sp. KGO-5 TaxID=1470810 RepID=UPI002949D18A|nr:hypothetical protein KGO5_04247 [Sinorhizobium sp. KGO-5]